MISLIVFGFFGFAIANDAKDLVDSSLKVIGGFIAGGFGGYYYGRDRGQRFTASVSQQTVPDDD